MRIIRYLIGINFVIYFISMTYAMTVALLVGAAFLVFYIIMASGKLHARYARMEKKFLGNLNEREDTRTGRNNIVTGRPASRLHKRSTPPHPLWETV